VIPAHTTHVAVDASNQVVGFVDAFATTAANGEQRWEIDLLAVHPVCQGQKIGQRLVDAAWASCPASSARALVQVANMACQGALRRCGFQTDGQIFQLMVSSPQMGSVVPVPAGAHLVEVDTLTYRGVWLEGAIDGQGLRAAQDQCAQRRRDVAGVLIADAAYELLAIAHDLGYAPVNRFQWWVR
jgi:hypothetical protein